jgi:hypothetical protein
LASLARRRGRASSLTMAVVRAPWKWPHRQAFEFATMASAAASACHLQWQGARFGGGPAGVGGTCTAGAAAWAACARTPSQESLVTLARRGTPGSEARRPGGAATGRHLGWRPGRSWYPLRIPATALRGKRPRRGRWHRDRGHWQRQRSRPASALRAVHWQVAARWARPESAGHHCHCT